jgi:hypothetical protein
MISATRMAVNRPPFNLHDRVRLQIELDHRNTSVAIEALRSPLASIAAQIIPDGEASNTASRPKVAVTGTCRRFERFG